MKMYNYTTQTLCITLILLIGSAKSKIEVTDSIDLLKEIEVTPKVFTESRQNIRIWPIGLMRSSEKDPSQSSWVRLMIDRLIKIFPLRRISKHQRVTKKSDPPSILEEEIIRKPKLIDKFVPRRKVRIELQKSLLKSTSRNSNPSSNLKFYLSKLEKLTSSSSKPIGFGGLENRLLLRLSQIQTYEGVEEDVMRVLVQEANSQRNLGKITSSEEIEDPVTVNRMIVLSIIGQFFPIQLVWFNDGLREGRERLRIPRQILIPGMEEPIEVDRIIEHIIMLGRTIGGHLSRGFHAIEKAKLNVEKQILSFPPEQIALISAISQDTEIKSEAVTRVPLFKTAFDIAVARMSMTDADSKLRTILKVGKEGGVEEKNYESLLKHLNEIEDLLKDHEELLKISKDGLPIITWLGDHTTKGSIGKLNQEIYKVVNRILEQTKRNPIRMLKVDELKTPQYST